MRSTIAHSLSSAFDTEVADRSRSLSSLWPPSCSISFLQIDCHYNSLYLCVIYLAPCSVGTTFCVITNTFANSAILYRLCCTISKDVNRLSTKIIKWSNVSTLMTNTQKVPIQHMRGTQRCTMDAEPRERRAKTE